MRATALKRLTRLAEAVDGRGRLSAEAIDRLVAAVGQAAGTANDAAVHELIAFATSAMRDATNRHEVLARVAAGTGVSLGSSSAWRGTTDLRRRPSLVRLVGR